MNILLTSAGRRSYIIDYFKACEGVNNVYASNSVYSIALQRADGFLISPLIYSKDYIPAIITYCKQRSINVVISLFDIDLLMLAKHFVEFDKNNIKLVLAPESFVEICNDKWKTYTFLSNLHINTPKTFLHIDEVFQALSSGVVKYPLIMKPRWGMASMGIYKVDNDDELRVLSNRCRRDIFDSYLKYESSMTKDEAIIYQEMLYGKEYGLDVINDLDGNYVKTFAKQKVSMRSGETDIGLTCDEVPFEGIACAIASSSHHQGILSVDCFETECGIFVVEMNCRISGHYPISHIAGVNYPQQLIDWLRGKMTNEKNLTIKKGVYVTKDLIPTILKEPESVNVI